MTRQMPPKFAHDAGWVFAVLAVLATVGAVWFAILDAHSHREVERFDAERGQEQNRDVAAADVERGSDRGRGEPRART